MAISRPLATGLYVQPVIEFLNKNPEMWSEITARQDHPKSPHHSTQCIFVRGPEAFTVRKFFHDTGSYDYPSKAKLEPVLYPLIVPVIEGLLQASEVGRILIVNLRAGGIVDEHIDHGSYADHFSRFHIVASTNPECTNTTGGEVEHWRQGTCWWFNHKLPHSASNAGETDRVHISIDAVAPDFHVQRGQHGHS